MEPRFLDEWVEKLRGCGDSRERRAIVHKLEPVLEGWARIENEILFPTLERFLGFSEWIEEARAHQSGLRDLIEHTHVVHDHERILDVTDELGGRILLHLEGIRNILVPRLIQTLKPQELQELRARLGLYWTVIESSKMTH